jgi:O-antigen/teichoic acid export membrane protein
MSILKKLASETATYGLLTMVGRLLNSLLVLLHTELFLPEQLAVQVQLYTYAGLALVIYIFGMETAFFRFAARETDRKQYYNVVQSAVILVSVSVSALIFLFAEPIARFILYPEEATLVRWFALIMAIDGIVAIPFAKLRLEKKAKQFVTFRLVNIFLNIFLNIFFLIICRDIFEGKYAQFLKPFIDLFYNPLSAPRYIILANLVANLAYFILLRREFINFRFVFDKSLLKPVWVYAYPIGIMNLAAVTNSFFDRAFLQYLLPENFYPGRTTRQAIGIYGQCFKLSIFMNLTIQAFKYAAEPFFFQKAEDKDAPETFALVMKWFVIFCVILWVGISLNLDLLADLFLKQKIYHEGIYVVPWLLLGFLMLGIYYNLATWFKVTNKTHYGTYITIAGAVCTILLNFLLVPQIGYLGCAIAFAISGGLMTGLCYYFGQQFYPVPYDLQSGLFAVLIGTIVIITYRSLVDIDGIEGSLLDIGTAGLFAGLLLLKEVKSLKQLK